MFWKLFSRNKTSPTSPVKLYCPCCGHLTIEGPAGHYDICEICYWEDDPIQSEDCTYTGGANEVSLEQARQNYIDFGASDQKLLNHVRKARPEEVPK